MKRPISFALAAALCALSGNAHADRQLTLAEAVDLALGADPGLAEGRIASDRARLAVLRSQLDRVTVTVDGTLRELWNKSNVAGPTIFNCTAFGVTFQLDAASCTNMGGVPTPVSSDQQSPEFLQGLSNVKAQVAVPLFSGFRVSSNVAMRQRQEEAAQVSLRQLRKDLALSVARLYWSIRRIELQRDVVAAGIDRYREMEAIAKARVAAGLAPQIDWNRAVLQRLQQEANRADLDGQARESRPQLGAILGIADELELVDAPRVPEEAPPAVEVLVGRAAANRPELARAELAYKVQEQALRIVRADWYPQLTAVGLFQYGNNSFNTSSGASSFSTNANPFTNLSGSIAMGLQLNINLFNMMTTWSSEKDARWELLRLAEEIRLSRRTVEIDVRQVRAKLAHLYFWREPQVRYIAMARDNAKILEARYQNGEALVIEVLQAQIDLTTAERGLADLSAQIHLAWLELDAALGNTVGLPR